MFVFKFRQQCTPRKFLTMLAMFCGITATAGMATATNTDAAPSVPVLSLNGDTVTWTALPGVTSYTFATVRDPATTRETTYKEVGGTSFTPPAVPGQTVNYGLAARTPEGGPWAREVSITYPRSEPAVPSAPVLSLNGDTVTWTALPGVTSYTLATVRDPATTRETTYKEVGGTSFTPPAVPGQTVNYGLAARMPEGGPWAREVSITYPSQSPPVLPPSEEPASGSSSAFGLPFVKGIVANLKGWGLDNLPEIASEMNSLGVSWEREDLAWESVEPQKGVFNWSGFDQTVAAAKAQGITILPIVGYAPSWAGPTDASAYAEFVKAAVARYGPGTADNLQWWEMWNEPYFAYAWSGHTPEPEAYAKDVLAAAEAAKSMAPSVKLLVAADDQGQPQVGGITGSETSWVDSMFAGAPTLGKWIDGVSVHPYGGDPALPLAEVGGFRDTSGQWAFSRIDTIRSQFLAHGVNVPFWITEEGWSTWDMSEETVAHNYADLFPAIRSRPWVRALFPFGLREGTERPTNDQSGYGLLKFGTWQPKSSWSVIQAGFETFN